MYRSVAILLAVVGLTACNLSDETTPTVGSGNNTTPAPDSGNNVTTMDAGNNGGTIDMAMPECSATVPCPAAGDNAESTCVEGVCVESCLEGFQDNDGDGTCTAECAADSCEFACDDSSGAIECACPEGWVLSDANTCELGAIFTDLEFVDDTAWTVFGAVLNTAELDVDENPGTLSGATNDFCDGNDLYAQTDITLPEAIEGRALAIDVVFESECARSNCDSTQFPIPSFGQHPSFSVSRSVDDTTSKQTGRYCVPPQVMGTSVPFTLQLHPVTANFGPFGCDETAFPRAARIEVVEAPDDCGGVLNGDFEAADDGSLPDWSTENGTFDTLGGTATGRAARFETNGCNRAVLSQNFQVPAPNSGSGIALQFKARRDANSDFSVVVDGFTGTSRFQSTSVQAARVTVDATTAEMADYVACLPAHVRGSGVQLRAELRTTNDCTNTTTRALIDEVGFVENAECPTDFGPPGGDFESAANDSFYNLFSSNGSTNVRGDAQFGDLNGSRVVELIPRTRCASPRMNVQFWRPFGVSDTAPNAVAYDYTYSPLMVSGAYGRVSLGDSSKDFTATSNLVSDFVCDTNGPGRLSTFSATAGHSGGCDIPLQILDPVGEAVLDNLSSVFEMACVP